MKKDMNGYSRVAAWAGVIGPVLFVLVFTLEGWLRPGYKPVEMYISALSLGPRGWVQIVNFVVFGILLLLFSRGTWAAFSSGGITRSGPVLLIIIATFYLLSGPFVMDPMFTPPDQASIHGTIHGILGGIVFLLMPISMFVFLRQFRKVPNWQPLQRWTLALGVICAVDVVFFTFSSKIPAWVDIFVKWQGLIQRAALVPFMAWVFVLALALFKQVKRR